ncbi:hypothetical protein MAPG_03461 [Magnaporthiopsis poae ATCC 64411]|uniref:Uncharacterized protein n=1 Tax=Magnaporthiopsis poae (strain ATCC 64411 / 73-15) TaxID=644358 RepID=A0A0C4DU27_MAGP6|nr:hypothetical protein MAPG_03461 [Magnaporthiopsis poae ATCC 64411]
MEAKRLGRRGVRIGLWLDLTRRRVGPDIGYHTYESQGRCEWAAKTAGAGEVAIGAELRTVVEQENIVYTDLVVRGRRRRRLSGRARAALFLLAPCPATVPVAKDERVHAVVSQEPLGVDLSIAPWNAPIGQLSRGDKLLPHDDLQQEIQHPLQAEQQQGINYFTTCGRASWRPGCHGYPTVMPTIHEEGGSGEDEQWQRRPPA